MAQVGISPVQLREHVVRPTLLHLGLHSQAAENLILGTIAQESHGGRYLKQLGAGPAMGLCQMEPATHDDIWDNYLRYNSELAAKVQTLELPDWYEGDDAREMAGNLYYAVAMCRVHYLRVSEPLPKPRDISSLGSYWKRFYNTHLGAGSVEEFVANYHRFGLDDY